MNHKQTFPSPCGEKVGINSRKGRGGYVQVHEVSVPLRGKGRDQPEQFLKNKGLRGMVKVSVPLRGKGRDQPVMTSWFTNL